MLTQTQHIIKNTSTGYKDIIKSCINYNPDQFILVIDNCVVGFIQSHEKAAQNGCSRHHKGVWDANPLKVKWQVSGTNLQQMNQSILTLIFFGFVAD